ncbi:hypothetical protein NSK_003273 [Nannochloropsis salina CCMP1776]|uniref:Uncharacterized protein n=1 Tax=Nannochloropsis salina CCMP1776 TaxID=1027361 RepID=A0A4D9DB65_9STRA|nr:hypothetical protein NSK_003273 [Nannochloropsis salina CCMP1776]|eukprot:TFJ85769.1 hypothetical protein NSK_003273 [Nannochloropsis salina CCMP1776]
MSSSPSFPNDALRPSLPPTSQGPRQQPEQQIPKPKVILLLHPDKQNHGLLQKLKRHADLVKFTNLETSDAVDLDDACRGVCETISLLGDDAKRQAQSRYYASLLSGATSSEAAEDVGRELFLNCLRLHDEKELWRVLAVYGQMDALAGAGRDQLLRECPIERATAESLTEFLDGLGE